MQKPLEGVRVLDFTKVLAGPLCTQYLSDMGAEVVKVETIGAGDDTRAWPPFHVKGLGSVFLAVNRGKRSIALDLKNEEGREVARRLARDADVVIESFGTGVAERLGIHEAAMRRENPDLIYCSISGYGRSGPMKDAPGYDMMLQAFCGMMALSGEEGGPYVRSPFSPVDQTTGMHALTGILAALFARRGGAPGTRVEVSLFDTAMGLMAYNFQSLWERGEQPERRGASHESVCPYQSFDAADGPVLIGVANDNLWRRFCAVAGLEAIVDDPRFRTNADRAANRAETVRFVQEAVSRESVAWWQEKLTEARVPCAPVNDLETVLAHPHSEAVNVVLEYDHPAAGPTRAIAQPVRFDRAERCVTLPPPVLGEHGDAILAELGFSTEDIDDMVERGVVGRPGS